MTRLASIMAICMLLLFSISAQSQVIHYQQNFDSLPDGEIDGLDGWAVGPPANLASTTVTSEVFHGVFGKSMKVDPQQVIVRDFDPMITSGVNFLSVWFRYELRDVTDDKLFVYYGEEVREWAGGPNLYIGGNSVDPNKVTIYNGAWSPVGDDLKVGEWQHLFQVIDVDAQTYKVYLDDVLIADTCVYRNPGNHKALGWLMFGFDRGSAGTIGYYDDLVVGEGDVFINPSSVTAEDKLTATWGSLKNSR